jgi:hypothetical protein
MDIIDETLSVLQEKIDKSQERLFAIEEDVNGRKCCQCNCGKQSEQEQGSIRESVISLL